uniref:ABC transporter TMD0 domain-containing protein n=2 Tax=Eptatretus burgeri TaxID=7764 RepID=A0A8C4R9V3_EPTBU
MLWMVFKLDDSSACSKCSISSVSFITNRRVLAGTLNKFQIAAQNISASMDWNLTLSHTSPDVPRCFQLSVLALVPCALLLLFSLPYYLYLMQHDNGYIQCTHLNRAKTVIAALLWFICWLELFYTVWEKNQGRSQPSVLYVSPLIMGTMMLVAMVLIQCERLHGVQSSGFMLIFWFLSLLFAIVPFRSLILAASRPGAKVDALRYFTFYTYFWLVALQFLLSCFSDRSPLFSQSIKDPNPCPEMSAPFLSKITFWWFTSLAMLGYKRPLLPEDLWSINPSDTSNNIVPRMQCLWEEECARVHKQWYSYDTVHTVLQSTMVIFD